MIVQGSYERKIGWREGIEESLFFCQVLLFFPCAEISKKFPGRDGILEPSEVVFFLFLLESRLEEDF